MIMFPRLPPVLISCAVLGLAFAAHARADALGDRAEVSPVPGWGPINQGQQSLPTLGYAPADGRNASVLLTLIPSQMSGVKDKASLKAFFLRAVSPMLPSPDFVPEMTEFQVDDGIGIYASFVDPSLVGKPVEKGNFKVATSVDFLLSNGFTVHATVFTDDLTSAAFTEGMAIAKSLRIIAPAVAKTEGDRVSVGGLDQALSLPPGRFKAVDNGMNKNPGYFFFQDDRGVVLSGWLDKASGFKGMKEFWAGEKASMQAKGGIPIEGETFKTIGDWEAVLYTVPLDKDVSQKNLRACRVVGQTWADIHLSITSTSSTWKDLEDVVSGLSLAPNTPVR
jgi:hypothetical protein